MGEIKEKYIGESSIKDKPKKKLRLIIGDKVIKGNNIADNAIGNDKLKDNTIEGRNIAPGAIDISKIAPGTLDGASVAANCNLIGITRDSDGKLWAHYGSNESNQHVRKDDDGKIWMDTTIN